MPGLNFRLIISDLYKHKNRFVECPDDDLMFLFCPIAHATIAVNISRKRGISYDHQ